MNSALIRPSPPCWGVGKGGGRDLQTTTLRIEAPLVALDAFQEDWLAMRKRRSLSAKFFWCESALGASASDLYVSGGGRGIGHASHKDMTQAKPLSRLGAT